MFSNKQLLAFMFLFSLVAVNEWLCFIATEELDDRVLGLQARVEGLEGQKGDAVQPKKETEKSDA